MRFILWTSLVLCIAGYICGSLDDPDLWWHIVIGRWIVAHGEVPVVDHWTLFGQGQPWRAYSWSIEILFALAERYAGLSGLVTFRIVMTVMLALSAQIVLVRISRSLACGSLLAAFYTVSCFNHITLRPQTFIWMLFLWLMLVANEVSQHGLTRRRAGMLVLLMCLWANIHFSAILGIALVFAWTYRTGRERDAFVAAGCAFAGSLITPYLGGEWLTLFQTSSHPFSFSQIAEFQPATVLQYSTAFPLMMVVLLATIVTVKPGVQPVLRWLLAGAFFAGSLAVIKFMPFLMVILCGLVAAIWYALEDRKEYAILEGIERLIALVERMPREGLSFVLIVLSIIYFSRAVRHPLGDDVTPVSTMDFFEEHQLPFPLLNPFGQGGYVMYRLSNERGELAHLPSIDGRTNLISADLWKMHTDTMQGRHGWERYIEKVNPQTILWKAESPLVSILRNDSAWCHVFLAGDYDQGYALFIRREEFEKRRDVLNADNCGKPGASGV